MEKLKFLRERGRLIFLMLFAFFLLSSAGLEAQIKVNGVVKDSNGEPLIGASVVEKGVASHGTATDIDGLFSLTVSPNATLIVSYVGCDTKEVKAVEGTTMEIVLKENSKVLEEVVAVGFGTQKKVNLTGSVGLASAKDLEARPVTTATQALQGLVPGLQISTNTGELDKDMSVNIRGTGTIGEGSSGSPLVLIDGMEGDLNAVNPQDIESVSVLKDAAASSIYGSRAPFGVILVTTKKGKTGKATINYNNSFRFASPTHLPEQMNSYDFAAYFNNAAYNTDGGGRFSVFSQDVMQKMLDFQAAGGTNRGGLPTDGNVWGKPAGDPFTQAYANTDWYKEIYKSSSFSHEHNLSISGGSERIQYYVSLGYLDQNGLLNHGEDGLKRYNVTGKINADLTSWLKLTYSSRFTRRDNERPTQFGSGFYERFGRQTWPNLPVYDENGFYHNSNAQTPAMDLSLGGTHTQQSDQLYQQGALIFEPIKNWITNVEFNYGMDNWEIRETSLPYYNHDVAGNEVNTNGTSSLLQSYKKENYLNLNVYSSYSHTFNDDHNFKIMVGFQTEQLRQSFFQAKAYGLLVESLPELDLTTGKDGLNNDKKAELSGYRNQWATAGFFGRLNYDYKGRYLAEVNMRYDGSSRFRKENRWDLYPSVSLGWNIAQENFWEDLQRTVNQLKLRASYGELGNQNTTEWYPTYRTMEMKANDGVWLQNDVRPNTSKVNDLISQSLTWETIRSWNVGLDYGLFNNRLTGSFDFYVRNTDNMVGPAPELPNVLGIDAPKTNNCNLQTRGWELSIAWNDRLSNGFSYGARFLLSDAQTWIQDYPSNTTGSLDTYISGRKMGEIWGFETLGIAKSAEEMNNHLEAVGGQPFGSDWNAGDIMYKDLDGKPGITKGANTINDHGDLTVIGNDTPRYLFGIDLNAAYKGFDLRVFFQGVMKRDFWQGSNMFWGAVGDQWWSMGLKEHEDYFRADASGLPGHEIPANLDAYYPRPLFGGYNSTKNADKNHQKQSRYLQNASYIRLKNLQVGYTIPANIMGKIGMQSCRVFFSAENLWTGTKLSKLFDPETINGGNTDSEANQFIKNGGNAYPLSRTYSFGLSLTL